MFKNISPTDKFKINKRIDYLISNCVSSCHLVSPAQFRVAVLHVIKQCAEVLSWQEQSKDEFTIIYYENDLPDVLRYLPRVVPSATNSFQPQRTALYNKKFLNLKAAEAVTFVDKKKLPIADLQVNPEKIKVYGPMCYGFGDKYTGAGLETVVNYFLTTLKIPAGNIVIYLGPTERVDLEFEDNIQVESSELYYWLSQNEKFIKSKKIKVAVFNNNKIDERFRNVIIPISWYNLPRYEEAMQYVIKALIGKNKSNIEFRKKIEEHTIQFMKGQLEKSAKKEKLPTSVNPNSLILDTLMNNFDFPTYSVDRLMVALANTAMIEIFFSNPSLTKVVQVANILHSLFKSQYRDYKSPKKVAFAADHSLIVSNHSIFLIHLTLIFTKRAQNSATGSAMLQQLTVLEGNDPFPAPSYLIYPDRNDFGMIKTIQTMTTTLESPICAKFHKKICKEYDIPRTPKDYDKLTFSRTRAQSADSFFCKRDNKSKARIEVPYPVQSRSYKL